MADEVTDSPNTLTIVLIALVATPILLFVIFWLVRGNTPGATAALPDVQKKGLQWAEAELKKDGFTKIEAYDAFGRGRSWRDDKQWQVCFQYPKKGDVKGGTTIQLAAAQTTEDCPSVDQGVFTPAGLKMPDLTNRTAYMASKTLGTNASVRFIQRTNGDQVTRGLGDWRVCGQSPKPDERFDGVPVTALVVPYEKTCLTG